MSEVRKLVEILTLPFESARTIYEGSSEVRLYKHGITEVFQIGKRVSRIKLEDSLGFKEAKLLQSIKHDHIVPVYDVALVTEPGQDPLMEVIEMIMPYYERGSVFDAMVKRSESFSVGQAVLFARDTLVGLEELHERHRLVHRDVKSGNVFIDDKGRARVGDLGVAIPMDQDGSCEAFQGMQMYTPPEVLRIKRSDRRVDIYGVGLLLHEMLSGPFPYGEYTSLVIDKRLQKGKRPILDQHLIAGPHVSPRLRAVINKAISREPLDRYDSARQMIDALRAAPFIDWSRSDETTWEGSVAGNPERRYRILAEQKPRLGVWRLSGQKFVTVWQRCIADQDVRDLSGRETREFFDQVVKHATSL